jgi:lysozyme
MAVGQIKNKHIVRQNQTTSFNKEGRNMINTIIDIFHGDTIDLAQAQKQDGIIAVIHKATQGTHFKDRSYSARKRKAKDLGLLWGAYHFGTADRVEDQVDNFLTTAEVDQDVLVALDFEEDPHGPDMTLLQAKDFIELIIKSLHRFPFIYGANRLRESLGTGVDPLLKNCPLWYARFREVPIGIPPTFQDFTLHQFTDGHVGPLPHETAGRPCDRNRFKGSEAELKNQWPFGT